VTWARSHYTKQSVDSNHRVDGPPSALLSRAAGIMTADTSKKKKGGQAFSDGETKIKRSSRSSGFDADLEILVVIANMIFFL